MNAEIESLVKKYSAFAGWQPVQENHWHDEAVKLLQSPVEIDRRSVWFTDMLPIIGAEFGKIGGEIAIDLGCGFGDLTAPLCDHFQQVIGYDSCQVKVEYGKKKWGDKVWFECLDIRQPLPVSEVDLIQTVTVLQHLPLVDRIATAINARNALMKGGIFLMYEGRLVESGAQPFEKRGEYTHVFSTPIDLLKDIFGDIERIGGCVFVCKRAS